MKLKQMISTAILAVSVTVIAAAKSAPSDYNQRLTNYIIEAQKQLGSDYGMAVAVVKDDSIIYDGYFGYSDFAKEQKVTANDSFYIASSTKPLVALATLRLVEKGVLDLDRSLATYFSDIEFANEVQADKITIRHLMNHTSGIDNNAIGHAAAYSGLQTLKLQVKRLAFSGSLKGAPLGTFEYTNLGYNILSLIIEREVGKPWQDVLREEVFNPAGMVRSSAYMSASLREGWNTPKTYSYKNIDRRAPLSLTKHDNTMHAAGGVIVTATDLANFVIAELNEGKISGKQVFSAESISASQRVSAVQDKQYKAYKRTGYGYGWNIGTFAGEVLLHHFGGFAGTSAHVSFMPEHNVGFIILANEDMLTPVINDLIASYAYDMLLGKDNADEVAYAALSKWAGRVKGLDGMLKAQAAKQAARTWQLSAENAYYEGEYVSDLAGTITIKETHDGELKFVWGNMASMAQAFTKPETVRVEFVPNRGTVVQFTLTDGNITGLITDSFNFTRK